MVGLEKDLFKKLKELGPKIVCVTDGEHGSEIYDGNKIHKEKARKVKVVETTGAGDAFATGFVFGMMKFKDIEKATRIGTINAENVIQNKGAKVGLLTLKELNKLILR